MPKQCRGAAVSGDGCAMRHALGLRARSCSILRQVATATCARRGSETLRKWGRVISAFVKVAHRGGAGPRPFSLVAGCRHCASTKATQTFAGLASRPGTLTSHLAIPFLGKFPGVSLGCAGLASLCLPGKRVWACVLESHRSRLCIAATTNGSATAGRWSQATFPMAAASSAAPAPESSPAAPAAGPQVVLVTGGTGLVGQGIRSFVEGAGAKDAPEGETWYYASSKDGDLRCVICPGCSSLARMLLCSCLPRAPRHASPKSPPFPVPPSAARRKTRVRCSSASSLRT